MFSTLLLSLVTFQCEVKEESERQEKDAEDAAN